MSFDYFGGRTDPQGRLFSASYVPDPHLYFGDFTLTALQLLQRQSIALSGVEDYFAILRLKSVQTGSFRCKLYFATSGASLSTGQVGGATDRVRSECLFGTASRPAVLPAPIIIPGNSTIQLDLEDVSNAGNTLHVVFEGLRLNLKSGS